MSADDSFISIKRVSKHFGAVKAVDDIAFDIRRGEFFSLLGPSGCGKTTLLRMLAGFEVPTSGEIFIDGQPMAVVPPHLRPTNMVFQNYAIFPHLNVRQNIAYGLRKKSLTKPQIDQKVEEALGMIKLPGYGNRRADQLSGGQRQRIALARALVCQPKVLLLDEPLGALDKKLREEMQIELRQIQRTVGVTFVFVTHDQEEALALSDRVAVMSNGKALQIDNATRLYEAPNCREVAEFIGSMNFFPGVLSEVAAGLARIEAGALGHFDVAVGEGVPARGCAVSVAVRPEKIDLHWAPPAGARNAIAGRLNAKAYFGDRSHYFVEVHGMSKLVAVARQNADRKLAESDSIGEAVWMSWKPEAASLLTE
jgi:spermidine/putrescine ABC transporter ATP-binding subunit